MNLPSKTLGGLQDQEAGKEWGLTNWRALKSPYHPKADAAFPHWMKQKEWLPEQGEWSMRGPHSGHWGSKRCCIVLISNFSYHGGPLMGKFPHLLKNRLPVTSPHQHPPPPMEPGLLTSESVPIARETGIFACDGNAKLKIPILFIQGLVWKCE